MSKKESLRKLHSKETIFFGEFIGTYCKFTHSKTIVEIGVQHGKTTNELCKAAKLTGGKVYGYDFFDKIGAYKGKSHIENVVIDKVESRLNALGHAGLFKLTKVDTYSDDFIEILKNDLGGKKIDFAFIDGCHSYSGVRNDFLKVYPLLNTDGTIMFHDSYTHSGIRKFMLDLYEDKDLNDGSYDIINLPYGSADKKKLGEECRLGLSILTKRSFPGSGGITCRLHDLDLPIEEVYRDENAWLRHEKAVEDLDKKNYLL